MLKLPRFQVLVLALCGMIASASNAAVVEEELAIRPSADSPSFSPDGSHIAMMTTDIYGHRMVLVTKSDKVGSNDVIKVIDHNNSDPRWQVKNVTAYQWLDNDNLAVISDLNEGVNTLHYVKKEGGSCPVLLKHERMEIVDANPENSEVIVSLMPGYSYGEVRVVAVDPDRNERELYRCESSNFQAFTNRDHQLSLVRRDESEGGPQAWYAKDSSTGEWKKLALEAWATVFGFDYSGDRIYVGSHSNSPFPAIQIFSVSENKFIANLIKHPRYAMDKAAKPLFSKRLSGMVGLQIDANEPTPVWLSQDFKVFQASMDIIFKDSKNRILCWDDQLNYLLIERFFSDLPNQYVLVNNVKGRTDVLWSNGGTKLSNKDTAESKFVGVKTRDGVFLDSYVTLPKKSKKALPLVVLVNEDPFNQRNLYGWDNEAQYLANKGFAVLKLNFRGTGGMIGDCKNDFGSVDDVMQIFRDYEDAIKVLAEEHHVDASRIAFVGKGGAGGWIAAYAQVEIPNVKASYLMSGVYDLVQYRNGEDKESIRDLGQIPFCNQGGALSDEDLAMLSPMQRASDMHGSIQICYGSWSGDALKTHQFKFSKEAKDAGVDVKKNFLRDFFGTNIGDAKLYREVLRSMGDFLEDSL